MGRGSHPGAEQSGALSSVFFGFYDLTSAVTGVMGLDATGLAFASGFGQVGIYKIGQRGALGACAM